MPLNKKLIHFNEKSNFMSAENGVNNSPEVAGADGTYGNLKGTSIVFIKDTSEIWTHGNLYRSVKWSVLESNDITFTIRFTGGEPITYQAEKGMTWQDWINSAYNQLMPNSESLQMLSDGQMGTEGWHRLYTVSSVAVQYPDSEIVENESYYISSEPIYGPDYDPT